MIRKIILAVTLVFLVACPSALAVSNPAAPLVGDQFQIANGNWQNSPTSFTYQWEDCNSSGNACIFIAANSTNNTYVVVSGDVGSTLRVIVTARNANGIGSFTSAQTGVVASTGGAVPLNTVKPTTSGTTTQGSTLTLTSNGTWTNSPSSFTKQWQRCDTVISCIDITGATASTYVLTAADVNHSIRANVTATNGTGSGTATSNPSSVVASSGGTGGGTWNGTAETGLSSTVCNKYASPSGSDGNSGTLLLPYATVQHLSDSLVAGQTGCLLAGSYNTGAVNVDRRTDFHTAGITITAAPGATATIAGFPWVHASNVSLTYLNFQLDAEADSGGASDQTHWCEGNTNLSGSGGVHWWAAAMLIEQNTTGVVIEHDNIFDGPAVTYYHMGQLISDYTHTNSTIAYNRIHDGGNCMVEQHGTYVDCQASCTASGSPGDHNQNFDNWMWNIGGGFGIQFWDHVHGAHGYSNVMDATSSCMTLGTNGGGDATNVVFEHNVCVNMSGLGGLGTTFCAVGPGLGCTGPDPGRAFDNFGPVGSGNAIRNNLTWCDSGVSYTAAHCSNTTAGAAVTPTGTVTSSPQFADASYHTSHDYRVSGSSPAATWGLWDGDIGSGSTTTWLGKATVGTSASTGMDADSKRVSCYAAGASGTIREITAYLLPGTVTGTQTIRGILYAGTGGGPTTRLAVSNEITFANTNAPGWYDMTLPTPVSVTSGNTYCVGLFTGQTQHVAAFRYDAGTRYTNPNTYISGASDPFSLSGAISSDTAFQMSVYANIE